MNDSVQTNAGGSQGLDIRGILEYLPHRYPMLLVDRVIDVQPGKHIHALKNITMNEPFFNGHFPHIPVMPGVLMIEALAQAAGILSFKTMGQRADPRSVFYFVGIDGARFKRPVGPGDQLHLKVSIVRAKGGLWKYDAQALVDEQLAVEAVLMCTMRKLEP